MLDLSPQIFKAVGALGALTQTYCMPLLYPWVHVSIQNPSFHICLIVWFSVPTRFFPQSPQQVHLADLGRLLRACNPGAGLTQEVLCPDAGFNRLSSCEPAHCQRQRLFVVFHRSRLPQLPVNTDLIHQDRVGCFLDSISVNEAT